MSTFRIKHSKILNMRPPNLTLLQKTKDTTSSKISFLIRSSQCNIMMTVE